MANEPDNGGTSIVGRILRAALLLGGLLLGIGGLAQRPASTLPLRSGNFADTFAFANASPIPVFNTPALTHGHQERFEFAKAYEVVEQTSDYIKIKLPAGTLAYVHSAHVTTVSSPQWLATTPGYNKSERELIRFWENKATLKDFLSSTNTAGSRWNYEEVFDSAPQFQLKLPILEAESIKQLGSNRQIKMMSVMLPVARDTYRTFESARSSFESKLDLYLLIDISGSTNDFLEEVMGRLTKALAQNDKLSNHINSIVVTTFGASGHERSSFVGKVTLKELESRIRHRPSIAQKGTSDREPLIDGLLAMNRGILQTSDRAPVLIVMSGADVELASSGGPQGTPVTIENLGLKFPRGTTAIFAQITPEPGNDLRHASQKLGIDSRATYLDYSDVLSDDIVGRLLQIFESHEVKFAAREALSAVAKAAHANKMMALLPRVLTSTSTLPARQNYAAQADWYAVRLWVTVDELLWKEIPQ